MQGIALNFLPVLTRNFRIALYTVPSRGEERPVYAGERAVLRHLNEGGEYKPYWTLFEAFDGARRVDLEPFDNTYATVGALRRALEESCESGLPAGSYHVGEGFRRTIEVVVERHEEGVATVSLEPYLLRAAGRFGILAGFRFRPHEAHRGSKRALQLSLSLDRNGQPNLDFYADRYAKLSGFVREFHGLLFPLKMSDGQEVEVGPRLVGLPPDALEVKRYVMDGRKESKSQFMGVQRFGPYEQNPEDPRLYFLYRREEHALSQDLFRALRGDTFRTFSGMGKMFRFPVSRDNVRGATISEFETGEIERVAEMVAADAAGRRVVPVVITPFSRHDEPEENEAYWTLKHAFLAKGMPIQVVASETVADRNKLKWSTSGIALQIFAKAGGTPWRVVPATERCLIVGVGQAHKVLPEGGIERFFAYSVLTDSTGAFREIRMLGTGRDEKSYIDDVIEVLRGLAASKATERGRGQAKAITRDDFAVILARAGEPRKLGRGMETAETAAERAQIDRAIAGVLFHAGLRRSEAADLRWGDVEPAASIPGALTIRVRTSKTNRDGEATDVRLAKNGAAAALTALRPANAAPEALVFRGLNGQSIGRRFAAAAKSAGVEGVTAHSGRVGLASELTAAGASTTETMLAGGWKTARMVAHYSAGASAERGAVAKYL